MPPPQEIAASLDRPLSGRGERVGVCQSDLRPSRPVAITTGGVYDAHPITTHTAPITNPASGSAHPYRPG
jgi:hypothetical protein